MSDELISHISNRDISDSLYMVANDLEDFPDFHYYNFHYNGPLIGHASFNVDADKKLVRGLIFHPCDFALEFQVSGVPYAAYFLLLKDAVAKSHVGLDYSLEEKIERMPDDLKNMLRDMKIFDFQPDDCEGVFLAPIVPLVSQVKEYLETNGYDVESLVRNSFDVSGGRR